MKRRKNAKKKNPQTIKDLVDDGEREKVLVAVDLSNIHCQVKSMHGGKPVSGDYSTLVDNISPGNDNTVMCFAAIASPIDDLNSYSNTLRLHNFLKATGFIVHTIERKNGKADGDVLLAVTVMQAMAECDYDRFVLVSADGDFYPLLDNFRSRGKKVTVASIDSHISIKLKRSCDEIIDLHDWSMKIIDRDGKESMMDIKKCNRESLDPLEKAINKLDENFDNMDCRRDDFLEFFKAISTSLSMMNGNKMKVSRGILTTLKDCMEAYDPRSLDRDDMVLLKRVIRGLKSQNPNVNLNIDIRNKFIIGSGSV